MRSSAQLRLERNGERMKENHYSSAEESLVNATFPPYWSKRVPTIKFHCCVLAYQWTKNYFQCIL